MRSAVIVAGGKGLRMQANIPKQFLELCGIPVLMRTIAQFHNAFDGDIEIVLVLPKDHIPFWNSLCQKHEFEIKHNIAEGGETRFDSVKNGLSNCTQSGIVGIHDGVRPLVSLDLIKRCYIEAQDKGSALPVHAISESLRKKTGQLSQPVDRAGMFAVETPQCFRYSDILSAYKNADTKAFTDDATVYEAAGNTVNLVEGEPSNIKITTKADLKIAEAILGLNPDDTFA